MIMILIGIILAIRSDSDITGEPLFKSDENREAYQLFLFLEIFFEIIIFYTGMYKDLFKDLF